MSEAQTGLMFIFTTTQTHRLGLTHVGNTCASKHSQTPLVSPASLDRTALLRSGENCPQPDSTQGQHLGLPVPESTTQLSPGDPESTVTCGEISSQKQVASWREPGPSAEGGPCPVYWRGLKRDPGAAAWVRRLGMLGQIHQERWPYGVTQSWALAQRESSREQLWCPAGMMEGASAASSHPPGSGKDS